MDTFRLLVKHEPLGLPAGEVARLLEVPQNTMSAHLAAFTKEDGEKGVDADGQRVT